VHTKTKLPWLAFSAALLATMMDLLDATIAQTAGPAMRADLGGSYADLQWITASYTLAMAVLLLTGGRLGDMFGRKRVLLIGAAGFTVASVVAAFAPTIETLIVARGAQGALGAVMVPQVFGLIRDLFEPQDIGKAFAVLGPVAGLSSVLGPVVSGVLIDADVLGSGWRSVFLINVPVGIYVLVVGAKHLPDVAPVRRDIRLDASSVGLAAIASFMVVFPLVQGRELGWPAWVQVMLAASAVAVVAFAALQVRRTRVGQTPLIETSVFAKREYTAGVIFAMVFLASMGGLMLTLGVVMQIGMGFTPLQASLAGAPYALGGFFGAGIGGATMGRFGRSVVHAGLALKIAGVFGVYAVLHATGSDLGQYELVLPLAIAGIGMGMVFVPLFDIVVAGVDDHEVGTASGVLQALQQLGMTLGVAGVGGIFFELLGSPAKTEFIDAAQVTALVTIALLAAAFAIGFLLPRRARQEGPAAPAGDTVPVAA